MSIVINVANFNGDRMFSTSRKSPSINASPITSVAMFKEKFPEPEFLITVFDISNHVATELDPVTCLPKEMPWGVKSTGFSSDSDDQS